MWFVFGSEIVDAGEEGVRPSEVRVANRRRSVASSWFCAAASLRTAASSCWRCWPW